MRSRTTWPISAAWKRLHSCAFPAKDSDTALNTAADVFGKITPLLAKRPVQGEAGFTVENLTEKELSDRLAALEARGVKVEGRIRISDY